MVECYTGKVENEACGKDLGRMSGVQDTKDTIGVNNYENIFVHETPMYFIGREEWANP